MFKRKRMINSWCCHISSKLVILMMLFIILFLGQVLSENEEDGKSENSISNSSPSIDSSTASIDSGISLSTSTIPSTTITEVSSTSGLTSDGSSTSPTPPPPSPFLKHGESYGHHSADYVLAQAPESVAVLLQIDNWSRWALVEPELDVPCGHAENHLIPHWPFHRMFGRIPLPTLKSNGSSENGEPIYKNHLVPNLIRPGYSEMALFVKDDGSTGVCGIVTYVLEVAKGEDPEFLAIMFSVPYSSFLYGSYTAVGISEVYLNVTGLYNNYYYYSGEHETKIAGQMVEYSGKRVKLRGVLQPDTYKPILSVTVLPINEEDRFEPGSTYRSPRNYSANLTGQFSLILTTLMVFIHKVRS